MYLREDAEYVIEQIENSYDDDLVVFVMDYLMLYYRLGKDAAYDEMNQYDD